MPIVREACQRHSRATSATCSRWGADRAAGEPAQHQLDVAADGEDEDRHRKWVVRLTSPDVLVFGSDDANAARWWLALLVGY
jgi:hypothetical protein